MTDLQTVVAASARLTGDGRDQAIVGGLLEHGFALSDALLAAAQKSWPGAVDAYARTWELLGMWLAGASFTDEATDRIRRGEVGLELWHGIQGDDRGSARAGFAPLIAICVMDLPVAHPARRVDDVVAILGRGRADALVEGNGEAVVTIATAVLRFLDLPDREVLGILQEAEAHLASASPLEQRNLRLIGSEVLLRVAGPLPPGDDRTALVRRAEALLDPLLVDPTFESALRWDHFLAAGAVAQQLGQNPQAIERFAVVVAEAPVGSDPWRRAAIEEGMTCNDIEDHERAVFILTAALPEAQRRSRAGESDGPALLPARDQSDVATSLAESLAALGRTAEAFSVFGLAYPDDHGSAERLDVRDVARKLGPDEVALVWCIQNHTTIFVVTATDTEGPSHTVVLSGCSAAWWIVLFGGTGWMGVVLAMVQGAEIDAATAGLRAAVDPLLGDLVRFLDERSVRSLAVMASGYVVLLPFWLLGSLGRYPLSIVSAPGRFSSMDRRRAGPARLAIAVDPTNDLPGTHLEHALLVDRLGGRMAIDAVVGSDCTPDRIVEAFRHSGWAHFAGHAQADLLDPARSHLVLAEGSGMDGFGQMAIASADLSGAALVVLSACSSGVPELRLDLVTRPAGLPAALAAAGAGAIVATMWLVDDGPTALFVDELAAAVGEAPGPELDLVAIHHRAVQRFRTRTGRELALRLDAVAAAVDGGPATALRAELVRQLEIIGDAPAYPADHSSGAFFLAGARWLLLDER